MRRLLLLLLTLVTTVGAFEAPPRVTIEVPWACLLHPVAVRVEVDARDPVVLTLDARRGSVTAREVWTLAAGRHQRWLLLPPDTGRDGSVSVDWSGNGYDSTATSYASADADRLILLCGGGTWSAVEKALGGGPGTVTFGGSTGSNPDRQSVRAEQLTDRWQAYPARGVLLLDRESQAELTPSQRTAIATWVTFGGRLVLEDPSQRPAWPAEGLVVAVGDGEAVSTVSEFVTRTEPSVRRTFNPLSIPGTDRPPTGLITLLVVVFALGAGPVGLWWCWRRERRLWIFAVAPVLGVGFVILLVGVNLVAEGLDLRRQDAQVVVLDPASRTARIWSQGTWFAPLGLGALTVDPALRVEPWVTSPDESAWQARQLQGLAGLGFATGNGLVLTGPWVPPRQNRTLRFTGPVSERGRLTRVTINGKPGLHNGLSVPLTWVAWRHPSQGWLVARGIAPGAAQVLEAGSLPADGPTTDLGEVPRRAWAAGDRAGGVWARLERPLVPLPGPDAHHPAPPEAWLVTTLATQEQP